MVRANSGNLWFVHLMPKLINLVFFQGLWFLTIFSAANDDCWYAMAGLGIFICVHFFVSSTAKADYLLAAGAVVCGVVIETVFLQSGLLIYQCNELWPQVAPLWVLVLWANFALTMNGCLQWLQGRYALAAILGALGGPASYYGGIRFGAATAGNDLIIILLVVAMIYACVTPLLLAGARRLNRSLR